MKRRLTMKYTKEQRLDIGRRIYEGEITRYQAAELYDIGEETARSYMRMYRDVNQLPPKNQSNKAHLAATRQFDLPKPQNLESYENMTKKELIQVLMKARINEARLKRKLESEGGWLDYFVQQQEYQVILELSVEFPVKLLCETMNINRSSFYYWKKKTVHQMDTDG